MKATADTERSGVRSRWIGVVLGAVAVAAGWGAFSHFTADSPGRTAIAPELALIWTDHDGQLRRGRVSPAQYRGFRERQHQALGETCRVVEATIKPAVATALEPVYGLLNARVPAYANWLFAWQLSYERDRRLLGAALDAAWHRLREGDISTLWPEVRKRLGQEVEESFRKIVLAPAETDPIVAGAWDQANTATDQAWRQRLVEQDRALALFLSEHALPGDGREPTTRWVALPAWASEFPDDPTRHAEIPVGTPSTTAILVALPDPSETALIRAPRPYLARGAGVFFRSAVGLSTFSVARIVMDVTDLGWYAALPGLALGIGNSIATSMVIDFAISSADEAINRDAFERQLVQALAASRASIAGDWSGRIEHGLRERCQDLAGRALAAAATDDGRDAVSF
ncbi:MAG: hypothetical protein GC191_15465 [Azospirillum sp.]|nr:hypothetical protein [Azospirillum sp.]